MDQLQQRLPSDEEIAELYEPHERDILIGLKGAIEASNPRDTNAVQIRGRKIVRKLWPDPEERIAKTHWIKTKTVGEVKLFTPNYAQRALWKLIKEIEADREPVRIIICKARQLGFSSLVQSIFYDRFETIANHSSLVISFDEISARGLFDKCEFVHRNLWFQHPLKKRSRLVMEAEHPHNSDMHVRTAGNLSAGRSQTFHCCHFSELAFYQDQGEVLQSAMQCIPTTADSYVFIESTAKGASGQFYDLWQDAELGKTSFRAFFAPWFWDPSYSLPFSSDGHRGSFMMTKLSNEDCLYMRRFNLTPEQMHWRYFTISDKCGGSRLRWREEYPASAEEAFVTTGSPVFNHEKLTKLKEHVAPPMIVGDALLVKM